jgi:N12 class adenine-specific DNA methylase
VKDWVKEIHDVLPDRKIGFVDPEMRGYSNREVRYALYQKIANSEYDIILMPESAASEIQLNAENDRRITGEVVSKHIAEKGEGKTARKKEQIKESAARSLENGKANKTVTFEDFGCNALFVDEAHRYKNLFSSNLSRETGLNDGRQSMKAMALFKKTEYIRRNNEGKNVFLLTATPLTNSPLEYYNMLMYVAPEELAKFHINTIDGFIKNFASIETGFTYDWKTGQVGQKRILTGFKNIQTLQNIFFKYTDYQNDPVKINLEKPDAFNKPNLIPVDEQQSRVIKAVSAELERYQMTPKEDREAEFPGQNFLTFYSQVRTASLDIELFDPDTYRDWKNPKLEQLAANAREIYQNTKAG